MDDTIEYFATCLHGFESMLADELRRLCAGRVRPLRGGVSFQGDLTCGYRVCLWSRMASRVTRVLARIDAHDADRLYSGIRALPWERYVGDGATIAVSAQGTNAELRNTRFTALRVKDALCDRLRAERGVRPDVSAVRPDVSVRVTIRRSRATVSIDFSGEPLAERGLYEDRHHVDATTAAGLLVCVGWEHAAAPARRRAARSQGREVSVPVFVDPSCADGTLVLEAAMMATDRAPGLSRDYWGFQGCADFDADAFDALLEDADERFERGLAELSVLMGFGMDERALTRVRQSARRLGLGTQTSFVRAGVDTLLSVLEQDHVDISHPGFVACIPPTGMSLLAGGGFYPALTRALEGLSDQWTLALLAPEEDIDVKVGYQASSVLTVEQGSGTVTLRVYPLDASLFIEAPIMTLAGDERSVRVTSENAGQFAARLRKNTKARRRWARREGVHAYRLYDADLPDYAVSVDWFEEATSGVPALLVSEYQAPRSIDPNKASRRFKDAVSLASALLDVPDERVFTRVRRQARGGSQYAVESRESYPFLVEEGGHIFELDLAGYLDTGLFLDHRITRTLVAKRAQGHSFLNLFAYTGSASVYAAAGGATATTTVDMSSTYLDWAHRNMKRNGFSGQEYRFIRDDVLAWVEQAALSSERYDLVFVDPPTFSNSKRMGERTWDIQRDHVDLLDGIRHLLAPGGHVIFSGNLRSFKLDQEAVEALGFGVEDLGAQTIPEDFARTPRVHFCYELVAAQKR